MKFHLESVVLSVILGAGAVLPAAPSDDPPLTPAQRLELDTLKAQLADPTRVAQTKREAANLLVTRTYPQAVTLARDFLNDASNRPAQIALAEAIAQAARTEAEFVKPLLDMLTGSEPSVRAPAAGALAAYKDETVLDELIRIAGDAKGNLATRVVVVQAMGRVLDKKIVDCLVGLLDDANESIANAACDTLQNLTSIRAFKHDAAAWKNWWAQNKHKRQGDWLADLAENLARNSQALEKENLAVRKRLAAAMVSLYGATPPAGRDSLLEEMLKDPLGEVRVSGVQLLQQRPAAPQPLPEALRALARSALGDAEPAVRQAAALAVAGLGDDQSVRLLTQRLSVEPAGEVREALYRGLGLLQDAGAWDLLLAGLEKPSVREAVAAAAALARVAEKHPPANNRRATALAALEKRYGGSSAPELAPLREALLNALAAFGEKELLPLILSAMKDEAATVRLSAVKAAQKLALPEAASGIARLTGSDEPDRGVRLAAISAVGALGGLDDLQTVLARTDPKVEPDAAVRQQAWTVAMDLCAKADATKLAALADQFAKRDDAGEFLVRLLKLWATKVADKPEQWVPVRLRLGEALLSADRPGEAAAELSAVHAALVRANSPDAPKVWNRWIEALLAGDDPAAVARIAENNDADQVAAGVGMLLKRLEALKARKDWDGSLRLGEAGLLRLDKAFSDAQRQSLLLLVQEAQEQRRLADRQRVAALVAKLIGSDDAARSAAARDLAAMKNRAVAPCLEELRAVVSSAKSDPAAEKAILELLLGIAPQLKGYDAALPVPDRLKVIDAWQGQLAETSSKPTTAPS